MRRGIAGTLVWLAVSSAGAESQTLFTVQRLDSPASLQVPFTLTEVPVGQQVRLSLKARVDTPSFGGHNPFLGVQVNGQIVAPAQLLNKPLEFTMNDGSDASWWGQGLWRLLYSPGFDAFFTDDPPAYMVADADPYLFVWDITPYVAAGSNTVTLWHPQLLAQPTTCVVADGQIEIGLSLPRPGAGAADGTTGVLPVYEPSPARPVPMQLRLGSGGLIRLRVGRRTLELRTRTSEPAGRWRETTAGEWTPVPRGGTGQATWQGTGCEVARAVSVHADHVAVADTIRNPTDQVAGVMVEHRLVTVGQGDGERLLCGRRVYKARQYTWSPGNPTALVRWPDLVVGLVAEDDILRVHNESFADSEGLGLSDQRLGLAPGASHTLEWSIYPVPRGDYWDCINAIRRNWGSNFTIPGPSLIEPTPDGTKSVAQYGQWARSRGLRFAVAGQQVLDDGILAEGTAIPLANRWNAGFRAWREKLHQAIPGFGCLLYLHSQISTEPGAQDKYADCRVLDAAGVQQVSPYTYPVYLFLPRPDNAYGQALTKTVEFMLDDLQADGIYNDCFTYDTVAWSWGPPWDQCTVGIDPQTHAVGEIYSSVVLQQQPWKVELARMVRKRGKLLIGNGPLFTRTMLREQVPTFTETSSFAFLVDTHLSCPWGLGTHNGEQDMATRAYMARRMLDHGGVYSVYVWDDDPPADPFVRHFFPTTPLELRAGVVIAEERILTSRSGWFGWGDRSRAEVHVFDARGKAVASPQVRTRQEDGRVLTEVKLPPEGFAALVRRP
ncbi:MAG: hypothetical protein HPY69_08380 [Armatimonadetes bacterium]|nr:hypothetical protein [Armatimonadota bacterium]